ncbi:hypothetical protein BD410DRAFT_306 [Rickenella mellea]|uniref:Mediator of RNA polymerase II transcription subunit 10 n=1 Tax=Rickenella mellea TaxID=50990 RepID=A0A4R5XFC0_9AGAM|nr:hypothetical protein BD410DRAFT_306 [Rickenella mellea]
MWSLKGNTILLLLVAKPQFGFAAESENAAVTIVTLGILSYLTRCGPIDGETSRHTSPISFARTQGQLESELLGLATALYNLGTTVINDSTKGKPKPGQPDNGFGGKPVGQRVNDVIGSLITVEDLAERLPTMIPMQVLQNVDNAKNPMNLTRDRL